MSLKRMCALTQIEVNFS